MAFAWLPERWDADSVLEHIIVNYRWMLVLLLLPLSLCFDVYLAIRNRVIFLLNSAPKQHQLKVAGVQKQINQWRKSGMKKPMCTARPGWQTISPQNMVYKEKMHQININLVDVLELDAQRKVVKCEPLVTMGQLSHHLDRLGWSIPVMPELDELTVGGLVMGTGVETSSHIYGLFQHICKSYELVLSDGSVVTCSQEENSDLYYAVPWSYGTLGFLTAVEIAIIPSKKFVQLNYHPTYSIGETIEVFEKESKNANNDFVECLVFGRQEAVVMTGNRTEKSDPERLNEIGRWYKPWFFEHVRSYLTRKESGTEFIPTRDYYHRHSRSIFWEMQDILPFGNHPVFRYLLGWLIPPKVSLLKLTQGKVLKRLYEEQHVIQDMMVPIETLKDCLERFDQLVQIYPIWLCPFVLPNNPGMLEPRKGSKEQLFVDIGVYGVPKAPNYNAVETTREIESFVSGVKGYQMMYADSYMTRKEFREMFNHVLYDEMRVKYDCLEAFPDVYDKVNRVARSGR